MTDPHDLPPAFAAMLSSFRLSLRAARKAKKTIDLYDDGASRLARWILREKLAADWHGISRRHIEAFYAWFQDNAQACWCGKSKSHPEFECPKGRPIAAGYANQQYRSVQAFFKWFAREEDVPNPMQGLSPPKLDEKVVPVIAEDQLAAIIKACEKGKDFVSRRDAALFRFFTATGCRLAEVTGMTVADVNLDLYEALVTGKGSKQRIVKFDPKTAQAIDRYTRSRAAQKTADQRWLWLSTKGGQITANGIRQMMERRGLAADVALHPHLFRHTFTHRWLDAGGAEGDLMELNGWDSPQMLRRYGKSARSARARRAYDRIDVMKGI